MHIILHVLCVVLMVKRLIGEVIGEERTKSTKIPVLIEKPIGKFGARSHLFLTAA